jgi:hypothetical protein
VGSHCWGGAGAVARFVVQQGLAAQLMLRRRAIPSVLYYGLAQDDRSGLHAHVWVRAGDFDVIGGEIASSFASWRHFRLQIPIRYCRTAFVQATER